MAIIAGERGEDKLIIGCSLARYPGQWDQCYEGGTWLRIQMHA